MATKPHSSAPRTSAELRTLAEGRLNVKHKSLSSGNSSPDEMMRLVHELEVHQVELEIQQEELEQSRALLEESLTLYTDLYDFAPAGYLTLSRDSKIQQANLTCTSLLGVDRSRLLGQHFKTFVVPEDYRVVDTMLESVFTGRGQKSCDLRLLAPGSKPSTGNSDTTLRTFHLDAEVSAASHACRIILTDITERKEAEMAVKRSELRFKALFHSHAAMQVILDPQTGQVLDVNQAAANWYGWTISELRQMYTKDVNTLPPEAIISSLKTVVDDQHNKFIGQHRRADGSVRDVEIFRSTIEIDGSTVVHVIIQDITERKQTENQLQATLNELRASKEKAEESNRLKSAFLANISHEIPTPMNGILGFSDLLKDPLLSGEEKDEFIGLINQSGQRMLNLINDLLDISRIDAREVSLDITKTPLNSLLRDLHAFFSPEALKKKLRLTSSTGLPDSESTISTDSAKLYQVLTNLIQNALKFTPKGGIDFGYTKRGGVLEFYVIDSGIGIPKNKREKIFDRFHQVDTSLQRGHEGAGLGLSIAKALVEMLGGIITVESVEGAGSNFSFTLPYYPVSTPKTADPAALTNPALSILIAEDDAMSALLLKRNLKGENLTILSAENGWEAVELLQHHPEIKLVLMDLKMPIMNGYEASRLIKKQRPDLPVIAQSAFTSKEERQKAKEAGCDDFITKPISKSELLEKMHKQLKWQEVVL